MEEKEGLNGSGVTVKCDEGPLSFVVESRVENSGQYGGSETQPQPTAPVSAEVAPVSVAAPTTEVKKKRGRPRKYAGDGSIVALSPMPISASIPLTSDYSSWKQNTPRPAEPVKKKHKPIEIATAGLGPLSGNLEDVDCGGLQMEA